MNPVAPDVLDPSVAEPVVMYADKPSRTPLQRARGVITSAPSGIWVLIILIVLFSVLEPATFLTETTLRTTLGDGAITGLMALAIFVPLVSGPLDISVANVAGFAMVLAAALAQSTAIPIPLILILTVAASMCLGGVSALLVTGLHVNSIIATLGVGTVALGLTELIAADNQIPVNFGSFYQAVGQGYVGFVPVPFLLVLVIGAVMYYVLEHTPLGRRLQACGGNLQAARLAGIRVIRLQVGALVTASALAALTGLILATKVGIVTNTTAPGYLLPAAAVLFLGMTQFKDRPNVPGTILALLILGTGIKGLELLGAAAWVTDLFSGTVLLLSVGLASRRRF